MIKGPAIARFRVNEQTKAHDAALLKIVAEATGPINTASIMACTSTGKTCARRYARSMCDYGLAVFVGSSPIGGNVYKVNPDPVALAQAIEKLNARAQVKVERKVRGEYKPRNPPPERFDKPSQTNVDPLLAALFGRSTKSAGI